MAGKPRLSQLSERLSQPSERPSMCSERTSAAGASASGSGLDMPGGDAIVVCASGDLADGGDGIRFEVERGGEILPAFVVRHGGRVYAYLNRCAHIEMELDWKQGKFFDAEGEYLICSTHGAMYAPESGACRGGPCRGAALSRVDVLEADGKVYLRKG